MLVDEWGYITQKGLENIRKKLSDKNYKISMDDKEDLVSDLLKISEKGKDYIIRISYNLKKQPNDIFYLAYSILSEYKSYQMSLKDSEQLMTFSERDDLLEDLLNTLEKNKKNTKFISYIYEKIRTGSQVDIIFNPKKINMMLNTIDNEKQIKEDKKKKLYNQLFGDEELQK